MKKKINLICVLIFVALIMSLFENFNIVSTSFKAGWHQAEEYQLTGESRFDADFVSLHLYPKDLYALTDSVVNQKTGEQMPLLLTETQVLYNIQLSPWLWAVIYLSGIIDWILAIMAIVTFIRLIVNINHAQIFAWSNVKLLRKLGFQLLGIYLMVVIMVITDCMAAYQNIEIAGYAPNWMIGFTNSNLLFALVSLLAAEVFAMGLRLQEEQDLTI
jgi:hypothetical protein